jgi:glycosyltransferase involved in cell wall biosynthesis
LSPDISYIVSAYGERAAEVLPCLLWSLKAQTHRDFEVIITDNSTNSKHIKKNRAIVAALKDERFKYFNTAKKTKVNDCYWSAEWAAAKVATGKWLCFPCDDCYYAPDFGRKMLGAASAYAWEMVFSRLVLYQCASQYLLIDQPGPEFCIKTSFILRADKFPGFSGKPKGSFPTCADRVLGQELNKEEIKWGIVPEVMVVHN